MTPKVYKVTWQSNSLGLARVRVRARVGVRVTVRARVRVGVRVTVRARVRVRVRKRLVHDCACAYIAYTFVCTSCRTNNHILTFYDCENVWYQS